MILSNARATVGLQTKASFTSTDISGSPQIGANVKTIAFPNADVAYSLRAFFAAGAPALVVDLTTGVTTGSTAWVAGAAQVETATAAGTATAGGNVSVVVTSAGMAGSPLTIQVPIASGDTAAVWAGKVRTALSANATISGRFTVSGETTAISLTRKPSIVLNDGTEVVNLFLATDATLNIALSGPTGVTTAATSANTIAGTVTSGVLIRDGDGKDFEGITIPTIAKINAALFDNSGTVQAAVGSTDGSAFFVNASGSVLLTSPVELGDESPFTITGSSTILTITVIGSTV